jgi:glycosyltransferase involved in cell wall biosynthesis
MQAVLWIAGDGEERDALYQQAVRLGILDRVRLLGAVADVESRLQIADIFVLSSRYEGLPMVLLEAMDAALPIVATRVGDIDTVIGEEAALLIDPECKEHLASALSRVVSDRILRNRLGSRAYDASLPYTDVPGFIAELEGIYSVAMQAPRGAD